MFTVGTDTEFFLEKDGRLVSAIKLIKAGKREPMLLKSGGNVTHDNVAMEFATPVAQDEDSFVGAIRTTMMESLAVLPEGIQINPRSSAEFPETELDSEEARLFGCDPDYDAWALMVNDPPTEAATKPFRTVGGHLHVGYVEGSGNDFLKDPMGKVEAVKAFDIVLGITMTILDHNEDAVNRRKLYGKAGCHRPTDYGVEYRSLSNFWTFSPKLVRLVYTLASEAMSMMKDGTYAKLAGILPPEEVQRIINEGDAKAAIEIWREHLVPELSAEAIGKFNAASECDNLNIYKEWNI